MSFLAYIYSCDRQAVQNCATSYIVFSMGESENSIKAGVKVKVTLEQASKAQRGSEVELYTFFNLGSGWGWVVSATPRSLYHRRPGTHCTGGWGWTDAENLAPHRHSIPGPPSPWQSLYRLSYPGSHNYRKLLLLLYDMYVSCHRHFFLVLLLNQR